MTDIQIAQATKMEHINEIAKKIGLTEDDIEQYGKYKAKVNLDVLEKEGLYITDARVSDKRKKHALYEEPIYENE